MPPAGSPERHPFPDIAPHVGQGAGSSVWMWPDDDRRRSGVRGAVLGATPRTTCTTSFATSTASTPVLVAFDITGGTMSVIDVPNFVFNVGWDATGGELVGSSVDRRRRLCESTLTPA